MNLEEVSKEMSSLKDWALDANSISKDFSFNNFKEALEFVNKIGEIAEKQGHHPDIVISYNKVKILLTTHSEGGLSVKDFDVAKEIDKIE